MPQDAQGGSADLTQHQTLFWDVLHRRVARREAQKLLTAQLEVRNNAEKQLQDAIEVSHAIAGSR